MSRMNWKQSIGKGNLTIQEGELLLRNFRYPPVIDKKGRLMIDTASSKFVIGFKPNGEHSTWVGVTQFKMHGGIIFITIILLCIFVIPGFIFAMYLNKKRKEVFTEAVKLMNQNLDKLKESEK